MFFGTRNRLKLSSKLHNQWFDHFRPRALFIMDLLAGNLNLPIEKINYSVIENMGIDTYFDVFGTHPFFYVRFFVFREIS